MRLLVGSITNWERLFAEAYQTLKPGGWLESFEGTPFVQSDDDTVTETTALGQWGRIFANFGDTIGSCFTVVSDGIQRKAMEAAGFTDIKEVEYKVCGFRLKPYLNSRCCLYPFPSSSFYFHSSSYSLAYIYIY